MFIYHFYAEETIIFENLTKQRGLCLEKQTNEVTKIGHTIFLALSNSDNKDAFYPPNIKILPLHERFISHFQG